MNHQSIQKAIHLPQAARIEQCCSTWWSADDFQAYNLEDMTQLETRGEKVSLHLVSSLPEDIEYHTDDHQTFRSLGAALDGGREAWLLDGYEISSTGLDLTFLPRHQQDFLAAARRCFALLQTDCQKGVFHSIEAYQEAEQAYRADLWTHFSRTICATGNFQVWRDKGEGAGELIVCKPSCISVCMLKNHRKDRELTIFFDENKAPYRTIYY